MREQTGFGFGFDKGNQMAALNTAPGGTTALTQANLLSHSALSTTRYAVLPEGDFTLDETIILSGIRLVGAGLDQTRIWTTANGKFEIRATSASARRVDLGYHVNSRMGAGIETLSMIYTGDILLSGHGLYVKNPSDWVLCKDMAMYDFPTGLLTDAGFREAVFERFNWMRCGRNGLPAILIEQPAIQTTTDGANNIIFRDCRCEYAYGPLMRIKNYVTSETIRCIYIDGGLWHGLHVEIGTRLPSTQQTYPLFELEGPGVIRDCRFAPHRLVGPGPDTTVPVIKLIGNQNRIINLSVTGNWFSNFANVFSNATSLTRIDTTGLRVTGSAVVPVGLSAPAVTFRGVPAD